MMRKKGLALLLSICLLLALPVGASGQVTQEIEEEMNEVFERLREYTAGLEEDEQGFPITQEFEDNIHSNEELLNKAEQERLEAQAHMDEIFAQLQESEWQEEHVHSSADHCSSCKTGIRQQIVKNNYVGQLCPTHGGGCSSYFALYSQYYYYCSCYACLDTWYGPMVFQHYVHL